MLQQIPFKTLHG